MAERKAKQHNQIPADERSKLLLASTISLFTPGITQAVLFQTAVEQAAAACAGGALLLPPPGSALTAPLASSFATVECQAAWQADGTTVALLQQVATLPKPANNQSVATTKGQPTSTWQWVAAPINSNDQHLATLLLVHPATNLSGLQSALVQFSWALASAMARFAFTAYLGRREQMLNLLIAINQHLTQPFSNVDEAMVKLSGIVAQIASALDGTAALFITEDEPPTLQLLDLYFPDTVAQEQERIALQAASLTPQEGILGEISRSGVGQANLAPTDLPAALASLGGRLMVASLHHNGQSLGILVVGRPTLAEPFNETLLHLGELVAKRIASALASMQSEQSSTVAYKLLADSPDPFFKLSTSGQVLMANQAMSRLLGYQPAQLTDYHIGDILAPEERDAALELLASTLYDGKPLAPQEWTLVKANGERRIIEVRGQALCEMGQPIEIHCVGRDLTARLDDKNALARRNTELATLHSTGLTLAETLEPGAIQQALHNAIRTALTCDDVTIYRNVEGVMQPDLSLQVADTPLPAFPAGHRLIDESIAAGQSVLLNDAPSDPEFVATTAAPPQHLLIVPLLAGGSTRGCVVMRRLTGEPFTLNDLRLVESIATPAALTLHNADLNAQRSDATTDLRTVLESIQQGVLMTDRAGRVRYVNQCFGELFAIDAHTIIGWHDRDVAERLLAQQARDPKRAMARAVWLSEHIEETAIDEIALARNTGRILERFTGPMRDPATQEIVGKIILYTDVTAGRQLERAKDEFLATASHELKTPITTLGGYLELLERQITQPNGPNPERLLRYVGIARGELDRLRRLSEDLLEVARIEAGRLTLQLEITDLTQTVRDTIERLVRRPGLEERGHRLLHHTTGPIMLPHDPLRISQVISNLLENALKYSPEGGDVVVTTESYDGQVLIAVRDSGIGVPESEREQLFLPFYRTTNASVGSPEGLGLGLYISRGIVEGHGGKIWVEPAQNQGTIFKLLLPITTEGTTSRPLSNPALPQ